MTVQDDGPGVPPDELERLFERFYRVPGASGEGSGLGLAIVKEVAEAAGGAVSARMVSGGGLSVEIRLPGTAAPAPGLDKGQGLPPRPTISGNADRHRQAAGTPDGPKAD